MGLTPDRPNQPQPTSDESTASQPRLPGLLRRFPLGQVVMTPGVRDTISAPEIMAALARHSSGDWGTLSREDWNENERSLREGLRILSCYQSTGGTRFWIISEADRASTCILLPEEY